MRAALAVMAAATVAVLAAGCGGSARKQPEIALLESVHAEPAQVAFAFASRPKNVEPRWAKAADLVEDGSGRHVDVAGGAFLVLRFPDASGFDTSVGEGRTTYTGPRRIHVAGDGPVVEVVRLGDFEAVLTWAIGLDRQRLYDLHLDGDTVTVSFR